MTYTRKQINLLATLKVLLSDNEPALFQLELLEETMQEDINRVSKLAGESSSFQLLCDELVAESNDLRDQLKASDELVIDYRGRLVDQSEDIADLKAKLKKQNDQHKAAMAQVKGLKKDLGTKDPTRSQPKKRPGRPKGSTNRPKPEEGGAK